MPPVDFTAIAGMIFSLIFFGIVFGFVLLLPISKRLGLLLEQKLHAGAPAPAQLTEELRQLRESMHTLEAEVRLVADRQQFVEQLVAQRAPAGLPAGEPR